MKKLLLLFSFTFILVGCGNRPIFDTTYTYHYAQIKLPDGKLVEGRVKEWRDYEDGDQLQVKFEDGTTYLTHASQVVLSTGEIKGR